MILPIGCIKTRTCHYRALKGLKIDLLLPGSASSKINQLYSFIIVPKIFIFIFLFFREKSSIYRMTGVRHSRMNAPPGRVPRLAFVRVALLSFRFAAKIRSSTLLRSVGGCVCVIM